MVKFSLQSMIPVKWSVSILTLSVLMFFLVILFFFAQPTLNHPIPFGVNFASARTTSSGIPVRLLIPKIKVDGTIESVGVTLQGAMGIPKVFTNSAWYNLGPRPGEKGSAVIDGHFGSIKGVPGIFNDLSKLKIGDSLSVIDSRGATTTFMVREIRTFGQNDSAASVFSSNDGKAHLNLITCEGVWNKVQKTYSGRLVIFTDLIISAK